MFLSSSLNFEMLYMNTICALSSLSAVTAGGERQFGPNPLCHVSRSFYGDGKRTGGPWWTCGERTHTMRFWTSGGEVSQTSQAAFRLNAVSARQVPGCA